MNFSNGLVLSLLIYFLMISYSVTNFSDFITENSNIVVIYALASFYLVKRIQLA